MWSRPCPLTRSVPAPAPARFSPFVGSFLTDLPDVKTNRDWVHLDEANRVANR